MYRNWIVAHRTAEPDHQLFVGGSSLRLRRVSAIAIWPAGNVGALAYATQRFLAVFAATNAAKTSALEPCAVGPGRHLAYSGNIQSGFQFLAFQCYGVKSTATGLGA